MDIMINDEDGDPMMTAAGDLDDPEQAAETGVHFSRSEAFKIKLREKREQERKQGGHINIAQRIQEMKKIRETKMVQLREKEKADEAVRQFEKMKKQITLNTKSPQLTTPSNMDLPDGKEVPEVVDTD